MERRVGPKFPARATAACADKNVRLSGKVFQPVVSVEPATTRDAAGFFLAVRIFDRLRRRFDVRVPGAGRPSRCA